jgi:hypothetical protein
MKDPLNVGPVVLGEGEYRAWLYIHTCGNLEWITDSERTEIGGGCDACESGSDDPNDWSPLYREIRS